MLHHLMPLIYDEPNPVAVLCGDGQPIPAMAAALDLWDWVKATYTQYRLWLEHVFVPTPTNARQQLLGRDLEPLVSEAVVAATQAKQAAESQRARCTRCPPTSLPLPLPPLRPPSCIPLQSS